MAKRGVSGWLLAGVLGLGWLIGSNNPDDGPKRPAAEEVAAQKFAPDAPQPAPDPQRVSRQQSAPSPTAPVVRPRAANTAEAIAYTSARLRVRSEPSTDAEILVTLDRAAQVAVVETDGAWRRVRAGTVNGWAHSDYLQPQPPAAPIPVRTAPAAVSSSRSGEPMRQPYVGTCDCPYDMMRNGRRCGGNSAYSRPGGRSPQCYF